SVDGPDEVEDVLADAVRRRPRVEAARRDKLVPLPAAGDDAHRQIVTSRCAAEILHVAVGLAVDPLQAFGVGRPRRAGPGPPAAAQLKGALRELEPVGRLDERL